MRGLQHRLNRIEGTNNKITPEDIRQAVLNPDHAKPKALEMSNKMRAYALDLEAATKGTPPEHITREEIAR